MYRRARSRVLLTALVLLTGAGAEEFKVSCSGCSTSKDRLRCDYYVAGHRDLNRTDRCLSYARYVDIDGAYPIAAWYYLLGKHPRESARSAQKGIDQGQEYARSYLILAEWILGEGEAARENLRHLRERRPELERPLLQDLRKIAPLYPSVSWEALF